MKHQLKSEQVYRLIREKIISGELKSGSRIPPEKDLAAQIGVGCCTLRRALEQLEEENLIIRLRKKGTFIAGNEERSEKIELPRILTKPKTQRNFNHKILVLYQDEVQDSSCYLVRHLERYAGEIKINLVEIPITFLQDGELTDRLKWLKKQYFSGVIIPIHGIGMDSPLLQLPDALQIPVVMPFGMDSDSALGKFFVLRSMTRIAVFRSLYYLYGKGHRKIGILSKMINEDLCPSHLHNVHDYELASLCLKKLPVIEAAEENQASVTAAVDRLLKADPDLTAMFCYNDFMATTAMEYLKSLGKRVPEDISVMGYSANAMGGMVEPPLTSVSLFLKERAKAALDFILNGDYRKEVLRIQEPQIIERESVKDINKQR